MLVGTSDVKDDGVVVVSRSWPPSGGVERPRRVVRVVRLMHQPVRVLGVPSAGAAFGGSLKPALVATWRGVC